MRGGGARGSAAGSWTGGREESSAGWLLPRLIWTFLAKSRVLVLNISQTTMIKSLMFVNCVHILFSYQNNTDCLFVLFQLFCCGIRVRIHIFSLKFASAVVPLCHFFIAHWRFWLENEAQRKYKSCERLRKVTKCVQK